MPTYQYRCGACGHDLEAVQAFTDDALTQCPACGADELRKRYGSVGVVFKGSGFYRNDSRADAKSGSTAATAKPDGPAKDKSVGTNGSGAGSAGSGDSGGSSGAGSAGSATPAATPSSASTTAKGSGS